MTKLRINQWAEQDRPREKMMAKGVSALTDAELLAILIGSGSADESAVDLMRKVLADCDNSLNQLAKLGLERLCAYKGIGKVKALIILAACELGKRRRIAAVEERKRLATSHDIFELMHPRMQDLSVEECWIILLDTSSKIIDTVCVSRGGIRSTVVDLRVILREAVIKLATQLVICHNHPSGSLLPSEEDDNLTLRIQAACNSVDITFVDHVIIAGNSYYSYYDDGMFKRKGKYD